MEKYITVFQRQINQHVQISEIDNIFGIDNSNILVNTVILAAREVICFRRMICGPLTLYKLKSSYLVKRNIKSIGLF